MLAPYALRVDDSRGRRHHEAPHPYRNSFQRDRDRVIHSRAFRRLEAKTQVFTLRHSDHFRNRLTHTIEVAQIARTIAEQLGLNVDLVEALALAHDIGHPPFGHAGEKALDACMREHGLHFDHNLHALRIVEEFERRYLAFHGLNLTFEVREGIVKHSRDYPEAEYPELAVYLLGQHPPLEAQLIDFADEIAYDTADLDDGFESRILSLEQVREGVPVFESYWEELDSEHPRARTQLKFNEALKRVLNRLVTDLIENTRRQIEAAGIASTEDVRHAPRRVAGFSPQADSDRATLKSFLYDKLYFSSELSPEKQRAETVVSALFEFWMEYPDTLPKTYRDQAQAQSLPRIVCDYIAGMTDTFIQAQHARLCDSASLTD